MREQVAVRKRMLSKALRVAIKFIVNNHVYKFDNRMRKQSKGGPICLDLTGEIAGVFMSWWDKPLLSRLYELGI